MIAVLHAEPDRAGQQLPGIFWKRIIDAGAALKPNWEWPRP
jgi:hypothetical protein